MLRQEYARFSIFAGLNGDQISQLLPYMVECQYVKDEVIFQQGQPADCLYVLLSGEVVIRYKPYDGPPINVARIEPGGVFGWSSALGRDMYTSGAVALQDCTAYRLRGSKLPVLCEEYPETGMILLDRLAGVITERLNHTHTHILGILSQGMDVCNDSSRRMTKNGRK
jgi:CRP/FNR family transcriptional regulator, cyclic AMP receptor protein